MTAYYNEVDPYAAQWLRNLIAGGVIAPGYVDERSIEDVKPYDLREFVQCHFFAGVGVWSYALRSAGWPDDKPVWTGSCPCQPFSAAGKAAGFDDERHLWPAWFHLVTQREPGVVFGEQVASKAGLGWLDLVQTDLEGAGYASGAIDLCSAGVGAPHIRQRSWFVAERLGNSGRRGREGERDGGFYDPPFRSESGETAGPTSSPIGLADAQRDKEHQKQQRPQENERGRTADVHGGCGAPGGLADSESVGSGTGLRDTRPAGLRGNQPGDGCSPDSDGQPGPTNGLWGAADWLYCRDGKWRPVEPGSFPLANGAASRVGRLRAYGNAINAEAAEEFIRAYLIQTED